MIELYLVGDRRIGHAFYLTVEGASKDYVPPVNGRHGYFIPWLRAGCSCQWRSGQRWTLEENAHADWLDHLKKRDPKESVDDTPLA